MNINYSAVLTSNYQRIQFSTDITKIIASTSTFPLFTFEIFHFHLCVFLPLAILSLSNYQHIIFCIYFHHTFRSCTTPSAQTHKIYHYRSVQTLILPCVSFQCVPHIPHISIPFHSLSLLRCTLALLSRSLFGPGSSCAPSYLHLLHPNPGYRRSLGQ